MSITLNLELGDRATPEIRSVINALTSEELRESVGTANQVLTQRHLLALPHNRRGWTPQNFYKKAANATFKFVEGDAVIISIAQIGMRQRYLGGEIHSESGKKLTIPVAEEAYGHTAADFGDALKLVVIPGKGAWLALSSFEQRKSDVKRIKRKQVQGPATSTQRERLKFLFRLVASVNQDADPNVLPTDDQYFDTTITAIREAAKLS